MWFGSRGQFWKLFLLWVVSGGGGGGGCRGLRWRG